MLDSCGDGTGRDCDRHRDPWYRRYIRRQGDDNAVWKAHLTGDIRYDQRIARKLLCHGVPRRATSAKLCCETREL